MLILHAEGPGPEPIIRLRRGLKLLLRACGLRCTDVREVPTDYAQPGGGVELNPANHPAGPLRDAAPAVGVDFTSNHEKKPNTSKFACKQNHPVNPSHVSDLLCAPPATDQNDISSQYTHAAVGGRP